MAVVDKNHIFTVYIQYFWQGNPKHTVVYSVYTVFLAGKSQIHGCIRCIYISQIHGCLRCIYTVLANPANAAHIPVDRYEWQMQAKKCSKT